MSVSSLQLILMWVSAESTVLSLLITLWASCVFVSISGPEPINYLPHCTTDQNLPSLGVCLETFTPLGRQFPLFGDIFKKSILSSRRVRTVSFGRIQMIYAYLQKCKCHLLGKG